MTKTHKTAAVIIPPRDVWGPIQQIRRQHDRKIRRWMPHITLIYPFCEPSHFQSVAEETALTRSVVSEHENAALLPKLESS